MTKIEKFGLGTAIIGLVADMIGLITFFGGLWNTSPQDTSNSSGLPILAQIIMALIVVYGWFMISWVLLRRRVTHNTDTPIIKAETAFSAVFGIGIIIAPILVGLWVAIAQTDIRSRTEEFRENAIVHATQTAQAYQATVTSDPSVQIPSIHQPSTVAELVDREKTGSSVGYIFLGLFLIIILFLCISGGLYILIPFVYPEISYAEEEVAQ